MKTWLGALVVIVPLMLAGCGTNLGEPSPFEGHWAGTWTDAVNSQSGAMELVIGSDGSVSATTHNSTMNLDGAGEGSVSNDGEISAEYYFPGRTYRLEGTLTLSSSNRLVAVCREYSGLLMFGTLSANLTRQ